MHKNNNIKKASYYKHFILERFLALISFTSMLVLFFCLLSIKTLDYLGIVFWVSNPLNMSVLIIAVFFAILYLLEGLKVIFIDYIPSNLARTLLVYSAYSVAFIAFVFFIVGLLFLGV